MSGRLVSAGAAAALLVGLAGAIIVACYDVPTPDCGFVCGPDSTCPDGYTCADDHYCHRTGAPSELVCARPDAALPLDAAGDAMLDASGDAMADAPAGERSDAAPDAMVDAPLDAAPLDAAPLDAPPDAAIDAPPDAPPDAAIDAMPDAAAIAPR